MIYDNVLDAVGNTPLIRLNQMTGPEDAEILVKFEAVNIGGSIKTRTAKNMIEAAEEEGLIHPGTVIVEPTSGHWPCFDRGGEGIPDEDHHAGLRQ